MGIIDTVIYGKLVVNISKSITDMVIVKIAVTLQLHYSYLQ